MTQPTRTFRIFVSSTFSDLKAAPNALQERVFTRLLELCAAHDTRFQATDLRWGVSEEASLDQQTMKICLGEIARCQRITPRRIWKWQTQQKPRSGASGVTASERSGGNE